MEAKTIARLGEVEVKIIIRTDRKQTTKLRIQSTRTQRKPMRGIRKALRSKDGHPHGKVVECHMYELTELPKGKKMLQNKWVYKLKPGDGGNPPRYKGRIVVKGF